jgi:high-affinity iron transporter
MNSITRLLSCLAVTLSVASFAQEPHGNAAAGKVVFQQNCAMCHGNTGKGDGPAAPGFNPRPANFTEAKRMATSEEKQVKIVVNGGASEKLSALMPAFGDSLSDQQVRDVVAFVRESVQAPAAALANK